MSDYEITNALTGRTITLPDVNEPPMPALAGAGIVHNGMAVPAFGSIDSDVGYPDVRSFKRKFGLLIPATNTSTEHELWSIIVNNQGQSGLDGVGIHTSNVVTPAPKLETEEDLLAYKRQFLGGLEAAVDQALLAHPEYLIMGMSLEHIIAGLDGVRAAMHDAEARSRLPWATWHDAVNAALKKFGAKRIGLISPFDKLGNENAAKMFEDQGYEVVSSVGFSCANAMHIAHIPDWAKEKAIRELLATKENNLDAIVQCGTNMSMVQLAEKLEPRLDIPVLGINATTLWYALRETGITAPLVKAGRLFKEH